MPVISACLFLFHPTIVTCARPKGYVCPQNISTGWMEIPPYVYRNKTDESIIGPLINILKDALDDCCLNNVTLDYIEHSEYSELVERSLNSSYDIVLPIVSDIGKDKFLAFPYVLLGMYLHYIGAYIHATIKPVDTGRKLNVHKTFRRRPGRLLNVLCTFNLRLVSIGK